MERRVGFHVLGRFRTLIGVVFTLFIIGNFAFPKKTDTIDYRPISRPMAVRFNPFSLPFAALEDSYLEDSGRPVWLPRVADETVELKSGMIFNVALLEPKNAPVEWITQMPFQPSAPQPMQTQQPRVIQLKPLVISKHDVNVAKLLPVQLPADLQRAPVLAAIQTQPAERPESDIQPEVVIQPQATVRPTLMASAEKRELRHLSDLSYEEHADQLIREELAWRQVQANPVLRARAQSVSPSPSRSSAKPPMSEADPSTPANPPMQIASLDTAKRQLRGTIEFTEGLAFTAAGQSVIVQHYNEGVATEQGQVQIQQGEFTIGVKDTEGLLVAKLVDGSGEVIGRGEVALGDSDTYRLRLRPLNGVMGQVVSAYSFGRSPIFVAKAYVTIDATSSEMITLADGKFEDGGVLPGSSFVLRAEKVGHWGSIMVGSSEENLRIPIFPDGMMMSLLKESGVRDVELAQRKGVIWGRVTRNGVPVAGAEVQLDGVGNYQPIYFPYGQLLIPDVTRTSTGENGYFAFVQVNPGLRSVQLKVMGKNQMVQSTLVDTHFVSQLTFDISTVRTADLKVTDAFNFEQPLPAQVRWNDAEQIATLDPQQAEPTKLIDWRGSGLMYLETDAGPQYMFSRQSFRHSSALFHSTPVNRAWLESLAREAGIRMDPQLGVIFGLTDGPGFETFMDDSVAYAMMNRVYFDDRGHQALTGTPGGGFVFFNVSPGLRTIGLQAERTQRYATRVLAVEPAVANVVHYQFQH